MGEVFCLFFERFQLTFCKEGLSVTGVGVERCQRSVPKSRWCLCVGFGCLLSSQSVHSSGACGLQGGHSEHSEISQLEQVHNTFSLFQRRVKLLGSLITCSEH